MRPASDRIAMRLVQAVADTAGVGLNGEKPILIVEELAAQEWASATFVGALHRLDLRLEGPAVALAAATERLQHELATRDIPLPGHFVAEIALTLGHPPHEDDCDIAISLIVNALVLQD